MLNNRSRLPGGKGKGPGWVHYLVGTLLSLGSLSVSQTHYTVPQNVWRISFSQGSKEKIWIGESGQGIQGQLFELRGYGKRYFDHGYVNESGYYSSPDDLYDLDTLYASIRANVGQVIYEYNRDKATPLGLDSLLDYSLDFFGPESLIIGGNLDQTRRQNLDIRSVKVDYAFTNRVMFTLEVPFVTRIEEKNGWSWSPLEVSGLEDFLDYHREARSRFDSLRANPAYNGLGAIQSDLDAIYERFYTTEGANSVLWALDGGVDPIGNGFYGSGVNPYSPGVMDSTSIASLMSYYVPAVRQASGLGDVNLGITGLLAGKPAWSEKGRFSVYGGVGVQVPSGALRKKYNPAKVDSLGRPLHFSSISMGLGVTRWEFSLFGEFYRKFFGRMLEIDWSTRLFIHSAEHLNTPVSFTGLGFTDPDSIHSLIGPTYLYERGPEFLGSISGRLELWPDRISIRGYITGWFKGRDNFRAGDETWERWMSRHTGYDTRGFQGKQSLILYLHNTDPLKKLGPFPFDVELGSSWSVISRNTFSDLGFWMGLTGYFQAW